MKRVIIGIVFILVVVLVVLFLNKDNKMIDLTNMSLDQIREYSDKYKLNLNVVKEYSDNIEKGNIISQSIDKYTTIREKDNLEIVISLGKIDKETYKENSVNELGNVPIMMYHGIQNIDSTNYIGGNIDPDGYNRTVTAFINDLEFYYSSGYRMISLNDYINGNINVPLGKSPIILTFDDGLSNNIKVTGLDEKDNIIIDPNSAVGILESFKNKYPDYNVTATFFLNAGLFNQSEYDEKIIKWLIDNNYSIGNHSYSHADFSKIDESKTQEEIGRMYSILDSIIPNKYINVVALPFGSPYTINSNNFKYILDGTYNNNEYNTISTLRVGWESEYSPFNKNFNKTFLKRIRAYDNNGLDFDIEMNFKLLEQNKYVSDGDIDKIVIPSNKESNLNNNLDKEVITY